MKKKILTLAALTASVTIASAPEASAQYKGPTANSITTVSEVLANGKDDQYVRLIGTITKQVSEEKYTFADETGEIRVEIDNEVFKTPVDENTKVEIRGEIENDFMETPEIDVESIVPQ
ncbi:MAG: YgiW/YdeI family stress tolerance OB fold protein [Alcanivorax sp.]